MTECLLFQIQMREQNTLLCGGELHDNLFLILRKLSSTLSYRAGGNGTAGMAMAVPVFEGEKWRRLDSNLRYIISSPSALP